MNHSDWSYEPPTDVSPQYRGKRGTLSHPRLRIKFTASPSGWTYSFYTIWLLNIAKPWSISGWFMTICFKTNQWLRIYLSLLLKLIGTQKMDTSSSMDKNNTLQKKKNTSFSCLGDDFPPKSCQILNKTHGGPVPQLVPFFPAVKWQQLGIFRDVVELHRWS